MSEPTLSIKSNGNTIINIPLRVLILDLSGHQFFPPAGTILEATLTDGEKTLTLSHTVPESDEDEDD